MPIAIATKTYASASYSLLYQTGMMLESELSNIFLWSFVPDLNPSRDFLYKTGSNSGGMRCVSQILRWSALLICIWKKVPKLLCFLRLQNINFCTKGTKSIEDGAAIVQILQLHFSPALVLIFLFKACNRSLFNHSECFSICFLGMRATPCQIFRSSRSVTCSLQRCLVLRSYWTFFHLWRCQMYDGFRWLINWKSINFLRFLKIFTLSPEVCNRENKALWCSTPTDVFWQLGLCFANLEKIVTPDKPLRILL